MWITNGMHAGRTLTLVRLEGTEGKDGLCILMVDGQADGLGVDKILGKTGIRGSETAVVHFDEVLVPADRLIGGEGRGLKVCWSGLDGGRIGIASQALVIGNACLDAMVDYAKQRQQFGRPIADFQTIGAMVADSVAELAAAKVLIEQAADCVDAGRTDPAASAKAKLYASEAVNRIAYRAVQVHGGSGYVGECRVEQLARAVWRVTA